MRIRSLIATVLGGAIAASLFIPIASASASSPRRVSAWLPYWDDRALDDFVASADLFDEVLPFWFEMRSSSSVVGYPGAGSRAVIDAARAAGVAILPTVSNNFDANTLRTMLSTDANIDTHVSVLTSLAGPYDGLDIDYENGYGSDRARFTLFIQRLGASLRAAGKRLSTTVHPKTSEPGTWDGPQQQDWAAIGAASDVVRIMAYDYSWASSPAGPVAPLSWVRSVVQFGVSQIPASKLKLGMPLYGYDWLGSVGDGVTWDTAEARRIANGATLRRSSDGSEPWYSYTTGSGTRTVYYSDAASTAPKLDLVSTFGLSGMTFWRLGGEDPALWPTIRAWAGSAPTPTPTPTPTPEPTPEPTPPPADVTAPAVVSDLSVRNAWRRADLSWSAVTDASAVTYELWRSSSSTSELIRVGTTSSTSYRDRHGNKRAMWYAIRAIDAAGNVGEMSARVTG